MGIRVSLIIGPPKAENGIIRGTLKGTLNTSLSPAVFLDRDGTLHRDTGYLIRFEEFHPLPGVEEALRLMQDKGYRLFVATNQSGVARGFFTLEAVHALNSRIQAYFRDNGINIEAMAVCPHHPEGVVAAYARICDCRKPQPGMLRDLAESYGLDLTRSYMAGDHWRDAQAGLAAGGTGILIGNRGFVNEVDKESRLKEFNSLFEFARSLTGVATSP